MIWNTSGNNEEQKNAIRLLMDNRIPLKIITGREGTGKTYITAAAVLEHLLNGKKYKKLVLTRTTDEVGKSLGYLPGDIDDKFGAHLNSFAYTFKALLKDEQGYFQAYVDKGKVEYMPIQYMRGVSFEPGTIIWADEIAGLTPFELRMLCTRAGKDCIVILTGSLEQIDRKLAKEDTGLYRLINNERVQESNLVGHVHLIQNERSPLSTLISEVL